MNLALLWLAVGSVMLALGMSARYPLTPRSAWLLSIVGGTVVLLGLKALLLSLWRERQRKRSDALRGRVVGAFREAIPDQTGRHRP